MGGRGNSASRNSGNIEATTETFMKALDEGSIELAKVLMAAESGASISLVGNGIREVYMKSSTGRWTVDSYKGRTKMKDTEVVSSTSAATEIYRSNKRLLNTHFPKN